VGQAYDSGVLVPKEGGGYSSGLSPIFAGDKQYAAAISATVPASWYENSSDPKVQDLYAKMNEAVDAIETEYSEKITEAEDALAAIQEGQKEQEDAAWDTFMDNLTDIIEEGNWTELSSAFSEWKSQKEEIESEGSETIEALTQKIDEFKTEKAETIQNVKDELVKQMEEFKPAQSDNWPYSWGSGDLVPNTKG
jgi:hypothetical protein